jgi:hypothetical protein
MLILQTLFANRSIEPKLEKVDDDECVRRLTELIDKHDNNTLEEVAQLMGRLACPVE